LPHCARLARFAEFHYAAKAGTRRACIQLALDKRHAPWVHLLADKRVVYSKAAIDGEGLPSRNHASAKAAIYYAFMAAFCAMRPAAPIWCSHLITSHITRALGARYHTHCKLLSLIKFSPKVSSMGVDIEKLLVEKSKLIDKAIEKWLPRKYDAIALERTFGKARFKYNAESANKAIAEPVWDLLDRGGKRWRPTLLLLVCEALGGDAERFADWAIIPELVHNGTLMVDDVEDSSELRRGKPCTYKTFGIDITINAGNALYYIPLRILLESKLPAEQLNKAYEIYVQEMVNISYGQAMDIAWHRGLANADKIAEDEYLQMCAFKTGTLARMAAKFGAVAAGASDKTIEKAGRLAESLGIAFQIQDDILNLTAQEGKGQFTKDYIGEDIHEGKRTLMVIYTLSKATADDRKRLVEILDMHTADKKLIEEAIGIVQKYGAVEYARERASELVKAAWNDCEKLFKSGDARDAIAALVKFAAERKW